MEIAVLSGKGGTGKTTVATNLSKITGWTYVDCDVEEPNGFIFFKPEIKETREVSLPIPKIDREKCILCNKCVEACQFNALANAKEKIILFEKLCHGCGACTLVCHTNALTETTRTIGTIDIGNRDDIQCIRGTLDVGEPMGGPIISQIKKSKYNRPAFIDCSPGTSCNVVKSLKDVDYAILVTEPTEFGLHDLELAVKLVKRMNIPFGVIVNRVYSMENIVTDYCRKNKIDIIGQIPFEREVAKAYSKGEFLVNNNEEARKAFEDIALRLKEVALCN